MARKFFAVDSGMYLVIDPCYLDRFMRFFDYDEMIRSGDMQAYVDEVFRRAYPKAPKGMVAIVETYSDGKFAIDANRYGHGTIKRLTPPGLPVSDRKRTPEEEELEQRLTEEGFSEMRPVRELLLREVDDDWRGRK